jgi:hypothetical protein
MSFYIILFQIVVIISAQTVIVVLLIFASYSLKFVIKL